ncbi:hypothetical protein CEUSTIGMA_g10546.t1 [Chlamydomonas eustigma]|uniref:Uncharacterized protein n=1 Tax=Chlamydomonas eustigma TaxID=1157962 RepID=A0A250XJZ1_9CHLO|nr:hypothetical protein CEUSTIGMA_g10546.t1 [Chlamydomonas eustigma]|eukprot:GAX83120.1 hypothetical protein CEUSTIGMA_g10546.t1 [Chlamydomonas eustigma]
MIVLTRRSFHYVHHQHQCRPHFSKQSSTARRTEIYAINDDDKNVETSIKAIIGRQLDRDRLIIGATALGLTALASVTVTFWQDDISDWILDSRALGIDGSGQLGVGDAFGSLLWGTAMYFASPLQLLLLFIGRFDTDRPSDWLLKQLGMAAKLPVDEVDYSAPAWAHAVTVAVCLASGAAIATSLSLGLGDATWSVSAGLGACLAAVMYDVGRPRRLSVNDAVRLEGQWQDFARFADQRLQRGGRCHESEVFNAFRREFAKYRREEVISDEELRSMIRNWHPDVERTPKGFLKNLSVIARLDPFTGESQGVARLISHSSTANWQ